MEYSRIISITGLSGLFELVGSKADGAIVRSLEDKSTKFVSSRIHSFSHLESIEVYTERENVNLVDVFQAMEASKEALPAEKDAAAVKAYFKKVYPEMDFDRVYGSDMKKMVKWFTILKDNNVALKLRDADTEEAEEAAVASEPAAVEEPVAAVAEEAKAEEKPAPKKRAPRKKKTEEE
jgi:hypothetical protein